MVGANPKSEAYVRVTPAKKAGSSRHAYSRAVPQRRWLALLSALVPLSFTLAQFGKADRFNFAFAVAARNKITLREKEKAKEKGKDG